MDRRRECVSILRRLLEPPGASFADDLTAAAAGPLPPEAAEQVARFSERIADLSPDERRELFEETFGSGRQVAAADRQRLASLLDPLSSEDAGPELWPLIDRLGARLVRDRNPYRHLIAAIGHLCGG